ncbi:MAG: efflux RND transporter periplasmic adaptor subunit, partial [Gammaproteobacteria bacterium]|nr:efflux RND transporter periplasmic adaptor subunit [Gammaproteobacteria bacterium]MBU1443298.1 efflux RND transporter periplasmic adaptor subunit [Gammaproteobacteria bacterium]MBU2288542.1 efflux RND transporter periplasmic adaptor subunit [Gammaproteobacteria bacterium]
MTKNLPTKQWLAILAVVIVALVLGALILRDKKAAAGADEHGHAESAETGEHKDEKKDEHAEEGAKEPTKGPHGGKLLKDGSYAVEVTIFETGVEPQFRLYTYLDGKPLDVAQSQIQLSLERLGQAPQPITFKKEGDFLLGDAVVREPHSFKVNVKAVHAGKTHEMAYEQIEARVNLTDAQLKSAGVELGTAGPAMIGTTLRLLGEVKYNADRTVQVVPRLAGLVEQVNASAGDTVRKGQVLAVLSSQGLSDQRAELLAAQRRLSLARTTYERERQLWEQKISAQQDMLQARSTMEEASIAVQSAQNKLATLGGAPVGGNLTRYELRSPIDGVVTEKRLSLGETVKEDSAVFTVSDLSSVWVEAPVPPQDLGSVVSGLPVVVKANAFDAEANAKINYISALVGEQTRNAMARIVLANPKGIWRPGLPVSIEVLIEEKEVPVSVSADAVQDLRDWKVVFGRYGTALEARPLELGRSDGKRVEVRAGLKAGERYAQTNSFVVKAELGKAGASHDH